MRWSHVADQRQHQLRCYRRDTRDEGYNTEGGERLCYAKTYPAEKSAHYLKIAVL